MIAEIPLATLLSLIWTVVFVMVICALSYWAANRSDAQSQVINSLTRPKGTDRREVGYSGEIVDQTGSNELHAAKHR